MKRNAQHEWGS